ncbi:hypothetical protein KR018_010045 [Drosophila ironensis]|nr:hypothetical protein KR018_010045 [Drosophila ironensis]
MNLIAKLCFLFALLVHVMGLKDREYDRKAVSIIQTLILFSLAICGQRHSKNGEGMKVCSAYMPRYTYNSDENECLHFIFGGCHGNDNQFYMKSECENKCKE